MRSKHVMTGSVLLFALILSFHSGLSQTSVADFWGLVNITNTSGGVNTTTNGAPVAALVNNVTVTYDIVGTPDSGYYLIHANCAAGDSIKFQVYGINASPTNLTGQACNQGSSTQLNLLIHLVASGSACPASYPDQPSSGNIHAGCNDGFCVHATCRAAATFCGDAFCDSGENCVADNSGCSSGFACTNGCVATTTTSTGGGGGGGGGAAAPPAAPPETPPEGTVTSVNIPVTSEQQQSELIQGIPPSALGLATLSAADVDVKQTGTATLSTSTETQTASTAIDSALPSTTGAARQALQDAKSALSAATAQPVKVTATLTVYEVKTRATGTTAPVSKITLALSATEALQGVSIIEVIPKSFASSVAGVTFLGTAPETLQADPVVQWSYQSVGAGERKEQSYLVNKNITRLTTTTVATAETPPAPPQRVCEPGILTCLDSQTQGTCREDGTGYDQLPCTAGCEGGRCRSSIAPQITGIVPTAGIAATLLVVAIVLVLLAAYIYTRRPQARYLPHK